MLARGLFVFIILGWGSAIARADGPPGAAPAAPPGYQWQLAPIEAQSDEPVRWYRGSMAVADAAAVGVLMMGVSRADPGAGYRSTQWYFLPGALAIASFGPIVHGLHGNGVGAVESLALRVGLPLLGAMLGSASYGKSCSDGCDDTNFSYQVMGGLVGAGAAMIIDDVFLAHERPAARRAWTPVLVPARNGGATVVLGGTF
jgi:hypothetical protein